MVEQDLDPVPGQADLAERPLQVAPVLRVAGEVGDDRKHGHRRGGPGEQVGAR